MATPQRIDEGIKYGRVPSENRCQHMHITRLSHRFGILQQHIGDRKWQKAKHEAPEYSGRCSRQMPLIIVVARCGNAARRGSNRCCSYWFGRIPLHMATLPAHCTDDGRVAENDGTEWQSESHDENELLRAGRKLPGRSDRG